MFLQSHTLSLEPILFLGYRSSYLKYPQTVLISGDASASRTSIMDLLDQLLQENTAQDNAWDETNGLDLDEGQNGDQSDDSVSVKTDSESSLFGQSPSQPTQDNDGIAQQARHAQWQEESTLDDHQDPATSNHAGENGLTLSANEPEDPDYGSMQEGSPIPQIESDLPQRNVQENFSVPVPHGNLTGRPPGVRGRKPKKKSKMLLSTHQSTATKKKLTGRTIATSVGPSDEDVRGQSDVRYLDQSLVMVLDGPLLRQIIHRIEADGNLCFKMRWYVARHLRKTFKKSISPGVQDYSIYIRNKASQYKRYRVLAAHPMSKGGALPPLGGRPINRLDFEATRATAGFTRNQPGWDESDFSTLR